MSIFTKFRRIFWPYPSDKYASPEGKFLADAEKALAKIAHRHKMNMGELGFIGVEGKSMAWSFSTETIERTRERMRLAQAGTQNRLTESSKGAIA